MKRYTVYLPITGTLAIEVEAEDEESAIELALGSELKTSMIESWEAHTKVCQGNVYHGERNQAEAIEEECDDA